MKKLSILREKLLHERNHILNEMKQMELQISDMKATQEGQLRLIKNVSGHTKNQAALLNDPALAQSQGITMFEGVSKEAERNERIAK